jgi:uncharacterized protein HemY
VSRIDSIRQLLQKTPDDVFLLYSLGMELLAQNSPAEALDSFRRVLELDDGYLAAYEQGAKALQTAGDKPAAADMLRCGVAMARQKNDRHAADHMQMKLDAMEG